MSDNVQRFYTANDMARVHSPFCEGCGECCRGMGDTIVLDPYDAYQLAFGLRQPFAELINQTVGLHVENGIILPHLAMKGEDEACSYLSQEGRCSIHGFRPGICRLYPLARKYTEAGTCYFILPQACGGHSLSKVRIRNYLSIPDLADYEQFKLNWYHFLLEAEEAALSKKDDSARKELSLFLLETFYLRPYDGDSFYALAERRMKRARRFL